MRTAGPLVSRVTPDIVGRTIPPERASQSARQLTNATAALGRVRPVVIVRDFSAQATCYAGSTGRNRPLKRTLKRREQMNGTFAIKNLGLASALALYSAHAFTCPLSEALAERYDISFSGFKTAIPVAEAPSAVNTGDFVRVRIKDESNVSDGFHHTILMNTKTKKAWILRTGGFAGVYQWFGPVDAGGASLEHCTFEPMSTVALASSKQ